MGLDDKTSGSRGMSLESQTQALGKRRQQQQGEGDGDSAPGSERKRPRTLQACLPCRRRKVKCNGHKPRCHNCTRFDDECHWPSGSLPPGQFILPLVNSPSEEQDFLSEDQALCLSKGFFSSPQFLVVGHAFHQPTFEGRRFLEQPLFLRIAICSLASLQLEDDELERCFNRESGPDVSNRLALIGQTLSKDSSFHPTVENILANVLLGWRELIAGSGNLAWLYTGLAIRMAQVLRLGKEYHQRHPAVERERRRRTMWTAFILDRLVSYVMARPQTIAVHKLRIQLPCPNHLYVFGEAYDGPDIHQSLLGDANDDILAYVIRAVNLWGACTDLFANLAIGDKSSSAQLEIELRQMEFTIETWTVQLPDRLHWSPNNYAAHKLLGTGSQFILLQMLVLHAHCITRQGFLPFATPFVSESGTDSITAQSCLAYAQRITEISTLLFQGDDVDRMNLKSPFSGIAIACAANIWIWRIHVNDICQIEGTERSSQTDQEIKSYLASITAILQAWSKTWKLAQSWLDVIGILTQYYATIYTGDTTVSLGEQEVGNGERSSEQEDPDREVEIGGGFPEPPDFQDLFRRIYFLNAAVGESTTLRRQFARLQTHSSWTQMWLGSLLSSQALDDHLAGFVDGARFL
ncbi:hypothetical protein DPV78_007306 [Talaromyces pinophilus]|nr:hypothetical protein DPV78_007306 [Talaromyces pinophilus]